jgi:hypothetical protein
MSRLRSRIDKIRDRFHRENPATPSHTLSAAEPPVPENRPLNSEERTLIEWLLANGTPVSAAYLEQLECLHVVSHCGCGCPTVDLAVGDAQASTTGASQILADFGGITPDGIQVGVILHARQGKISELEVYSEEGRTSRLLPIITTLKRY